MSDGSPPPELLTAFETAFSDNLCLGFQYVDRHGKRSSRVVEAHGLLRDEPFQPDFEGLERQYLAQREQ